MNTAEQQVLPPVAAAFREGGEIYLFCSKSVSGSVFPGFSQRPVFLLGLIQVRVFCFFLIMMEEGKKNPE